MPALPLSGSHFIVCGDGPLAFRIIEDLTSRYREPVTVILPSRRQNHGPRISELPGVRVLERPELTSEAFTDADIASARAVALLWQEDLTNFHAALRAQELNAGIRLVVAAFNTRLGEHFRGFFTDCTVLSGTEVAAPAFVAAALGEPAPSHVEVFGRTLYVARRDDVAPEHIVCGLVAVPGDPAGATRLLPPGMPYIDPGADPNMTRPDRASTPPNERLVLAVSNGERRDPLARQRHPLRATVALARRLAWNRYGAVFAVLLSAAVVGFVLLLNTVPPQGPRALFRHERPLPDHHGPDRVRPNRGRRQHHGEAVPDHPHDRRPGGPPGRDRPHRRRPADRNAARRAKAPGRAHHRGRPRQRRHPDRHRAPRPRLRRGLRRPGPQGQGRPASPPTRPSAGGRRRVRRGDAACRGHRQQHRPRLGDQR